MAYSTITTKLPISKNVIYDSRNDTSTGRKKAVNFTGGVSVAERARLFGAQITHSSVTKNPASQRPLVNKQPTKSNVIQQEQNYESYKTNTNRQSRQNSSYSSPERKSNNYRSSPIRNNDRPKRELPPSTNSHGYSTVRRSPNSHNHHHHHHHHHHKQRTEPTYDTLRPRTKKKQPSITTNYTQIIPGEPYRYDDNPYYDSYINQQPLSNNSNYFQPIRDPLEALYRSSAQNYSQQQMPMTVDNNFNGLQEFDLGNLINRIQEDYLNNVRPYVSSVQFIENEQNLADIGLMTPSTARKNYSRRNNDIYLRQGASYHYDIIDTNDLYPRYTRPVYHDNYDHPSSMRRKRKHRIRYHDQALSPIHIFETPNKSKPPESPPPPPSVQKPPTPVVETESEEEEEEGDTVTANTKTEEAETSSEEEEEEEEESTESPLKALNEITRPTLPNLTPSLPVRPPAKPVASESSESEDSDSDSDSDSDDDEDKKPKPRTPAATPQTNNRAVPQRTTPATPQTNIRVLGQRTANNNNNDNTNQPPETQSVKSFDLQSTKKSSGMGGKFKSFTNIFRRKKS